MRVIVPSDGKQRLVMHCIILMQLPGVVSKTGIGDGIAIAYICTIGFFTGLLAVATSAQLFLSHLVSRYLDAASPIKAFSKLNRMGWFLAQTLLTLMVGCLVFPAPYRNALWVILGDREMGISSRTIRLGIAIMWTIANSSVLFDTMLFSVMSLRKLVMNKEKGGALLVLMAAAGASDFINFKKIHDALSVAAELDDIVTWHQASSKDKQLTFTATSFSSTLASRLTEDHEAAKKGKEAEQRIASSLLQVGAQPFETLKVAALRANFLRISGKLVSAQGNCESPAIIRSELSLSQHLTYRAMLNTGREPYWRFTLVKISIGPSRLCEPRIAALDALHTHGRMAKWPQDHITVRNSVLHWARARATAEWASVLDIKPNFTVQLRDARLASQVNAKWWQNTQVLWKSFSKVSFIEHRHLPVEEQKRFELELDYWRDLSKFGQGCEGYQESWKRDRVSMLDPLGHGKDWSETYVFTEKSTTLSPGWSLECSGTPLSIAAAMDLRGTGENMGGMTASGWFSLLLLDMTLMLRKMMFTGAVIDEHFATFTIGLRLFGMILVATRRAGRHELTIRGTLTEDQAEHYISADFIYSLGYSCTKHCRGQDQRIMACWEDDVPAEILQGSVKPGDFVATVSGEVEV